VRFDFLSGDARRVVIAAQKTAAGRNQPEVDVLHLLVALLEVPEIEDIVAAAGADRKALRAPVEQALGKLPQVTGEAVYLGDGMLRLLDLAQAEARDRGAEQVGPEHLLGALPLEPGSPAATLLRDAGVTLPKI